MSPPHPPRRYWLALWAWATLMAAVVPAGVSAADISRLPLGEALTRVTVWPALIYYALAVGAALRTPWADWWATAGRAELARVCWLLGWASFVVHVGTAFVFYHHLSHAEAFTHVESVSGFGPGIYVSYMFTLVWTIDVWWWVARRESYANRPQWLGVAVHGFMAFVVFNATVVYETGFIRWAGVAMFAVLAALFWRTRGVRSPSAPR